MTDREKLIELMKVPIYCLEGADRAEVVADFLLDNGVTFATNANKGSKWISVEDELPALIPCDAGTAYSDAVNVLTSGHKALTAIWDGSDFIADALFWDAEGEQITHWAPLPAIPELPKEAIR